MPVQPGALARMMRKHMGRFEAEMFANLHKLTLMKVRARPA
jgi:hypothetical protein